MLIHRSDCDTCNHLRHQSTCLTSLILTQKKNAQGLYVSRTLRPQSAWTATYVSIGELLFIEGFQDLLCGGFMKSEMQLAKIKYIYITIH